jgi:hypothetical protein
VGCVRLVIQNKQIGEIEIEDTEGFREISTRTLKTGESGLKK